MAGPLLAEMRTINRQIIESGGYETDINLVSDTDPVVDIDTQAGVTYHNMTVDPESGQEISASQIHAIVNINNLIDLGYPVFRDEKRPDYPDLLDDILRFTDANGKARKIKVVDQRPDFTFGCSVLFFEEAE